MGDVQHPAGMKVNRQREGEANKKPATHVPHTTYGTCPFTCPVALSVVVLDVTPTATAAAVDTGCLLWCDLCDAVVFVQQGKHSLNTTTHHYK